MTSSTGQEQPCRHCCSGDQARGPQLREQVEERFVRGLPGAKAQLAALCHVGHHFERAPEIEIGMPGRGQPVERRLGQAVALDDAFDVLDDLMCDSQHVGGDAEAVMN